MVAEQVGAVGDMGYCTYVGRIGVHPHVPRLRLLGGQLGGFRVYRQDWTAKPVVGVTETVIVENEAFLAGGRGTEL